MAYYLSVFLLLFLILLALGKQELILNFNFLYFDAVNYQRIVEFGYDGYLVAFFPAFPALWYILNVSAAGVCLINGIIFCISYTMLSSSFSFSTNTHIKILALPSFLFCFLPYSESLFFLFSTLILIGLKKNDLRLLCIGLFMASMTRPVAFVFIPTILLSYTLSENINIKRARYFMFTIFSSLLGLLAVFLFQYLHTGKWMTFFEEQEKGWGNSLAMPKFPLSSWGGDYIVMYDGLALWLCLIFGMMFLKHTLKDSPFNSKKSLPYLFSLSFIAGTGLLILISREGQLFSLNRFIYSSPFFVLGLSNILKSRIETQQIIFLSGLFLLFSLCLGSYLHIKGILHYSLIALAIGAFLYLNQSRKIFQYITILSLIAIQLYFLNRVLTNQWVG